MNPLDAHKAMMDQLEVLATRDEARAKSLEDGLRLEQGRNAAVTQIMQRIEQHAEKLRHPVTQDAEGETTPREMTELELQRLSGVNDALAYLRAEERASQNNLLTGVGRIEELRNTRDANREEAKKLATRITTMLQEMQRGVPRDMVGRPQSEGEVRRDIVSRKADAKTSGQKKVPAKKSRG